jgi:hypothetical protein
MNQQSRATALLAVAALATCWVVALAASGQAASITYGDVSTPKFDFSAFTESSTTDAVPLFGAPAGFDSGLNFNPKGFVAAGANGVADQTHGQLVATITGRSPSPATRWGFTSLALSEFGDFTLLGAGSAATTAGVELNAVVTIREINGQAVAPLVVSASTSLAYDLLADGGALQSWDATLLIDLGPNLQPGQAVTMAQVVLDNSLNSASEAGTIAFIAKKDFVVSIPDPLVADVVPEPMSLAWVAVALACAARRRR